MPDVYKQTSFETVILTILAIVILAICVGCIYAFLRAIFLFILSHGDEEKIKAARNSVRYMIIGIILTIFLLFVFPILFQMLNVQGYKNYTAKNIFSRAGEVIQTLFKRWEGRKNSQIRTDGGYDDYTL